MTALDLQQIGREMSAARAAVPLRVRPKFDIESRDFFNAIGHAINSGDTARATALLAQWNRRCEWLTRAPDCAAAPPCLVRRDGENITDYINRCIDAKGK
jgi:hypothetical protein